MKALRLLKENVRELLALRKEDQVSLARWVGHSKAWINKFLNEADAEVQLKDLDRIADFLGVVTYQLFQPGISKRAERRIGRDRRAGIDRRIGHQGRLLAQLRQEQNKLPTVVHEATSRISTISPEVRRLVAAIEREIHAEDARRQAPVDGAAHADPSARDRRTR